MAKMTEALVVQFYPLLKAITQAKDAKCRKQLLQQLSRDPQFAQCMKEITENVVEQNIPLSTKDKIKLNKQSKVIRALRNSRGISQSGGFLNIVVPLLASVVGEIIASQVAKR